MEWKMKCNFEELQRANCTLGGMTLLKLSLRWPPWLMFVTCFRALFLGAITKYECNTVINKRGDVSVYLKMFYNVCCDSDLGDIMDVKPHGKQTHCSNCICTKLLVKPKDFVFNFYPNFFLPRWDLVLHAVQFQSSTQEGGVVLSEKCSENAQLLCRWTEVWRLTLRFYFRVT